MDVDVERASLAEAGAPRPQSPPKGPRSLILLQPPKTFGTFESRMNNRKPLPTGPRNSNESRTSMKRARSPSPETGRHLIPARWHRAPETPSTTDQGWAARSLPVGSRVPVSAGNVPSVPFSSSDATPSRTETPRLSLETSAVTHPLLEWLTDPPVPTIRVRPISVELMEESSGLKPQPLAEQLTDPLSAAPALLNRLSSEEQLGLLRCLDVRLGERVSNIAAGKVKKRKHNRAGKRKAWIARMEELRELVPEVFDELEEWESALLFVWADNDIDWFIDMDEGDPELDANE
ncbi:hypothetical protein K438DRAFT_1996640 [Mycena galopus ATCC 62051]|nr:hypothetical protein K438DRAFT_1996640 [Mycena galopus ATCC 62051]